MSLKGKTGVVTGGGSGMGRACCIQLARDGAAIAVWDMNDAGAQETVAMIANEGGKAIACKVDISARADVQAAADRTRKELGAITVLVNNAGISTPGVPFHELTDAEWDRMHNINLRGTFIVTQTIIPDMRAAKWGRIVNVTSSSTLLGAVKMSHYVSSKGGMQGLTKALAREYAREGITVNAVPPNFVDTPMLRQNATPEAIEASKRNSIMGRAADVDDIAAAVSYLCSVAAKHVNGHTLNVNGGNYMT